MNETREYIEISIEFSFQTNWKFKFDLKRNRKTILAIGTINVSWLELQIVFA